jgi:hypothetical protein
MRQQGKMSGEGASGPDWTVVDEGWGRKAADFATLSEPGNPLVTSAAPETKGDHDDQCQ